MVIEAAIYRAEKSQKTLEKSSVEEAVLGSITALQFIV